MADVATLSVLLRAKDQASQTLKGFSSRIKASEQDIRKMGLGFAAAGAAVTGALAAATFSFAKAGDEIQKMSLRTGLSVEALSELRHAAELSGTSITGMETGFRRMSSILLDAQFGLAEAVRSFDLLGVSAQELQGIGVENQFFALVEALSKVEDETLKVALAQDIFGRTGTQLLPVVAQGVEGLEAMRQQARDLGLVFDQEAANKAAAFQDSLVTLKASLSGVAFEIGGTIAPLITNLANNVADLTSGIRAWASEHPELTRLLLLGGGAVGAFSLAVGGTLLVLPTLVTGVRLLTGAFAILRTVQLTTIAANIALIGETALIAAVRLAAVPALIIGAAAALKSGSAILSQEGFGLGPRGQEAFEKSSFDFLAISTAQFRDELEGLLKPLDNVVTGMFDAGPSVADLEAAFKSASTAANPGLTGAVGAVSMALGELETQLDTFGFPLKEMSSFNSEAWRASQLMETFREGMQKAEEAARPLSTAVEHTFDRLGIPQVTPQNIKVFDLNTPQGRAAAVIAEITSQERIARAREAARKREEDAAAQAAEDMQRFLFENLRMELDIRKRYWSDTLAAQKAGNDAEIAEERRKFDELTRQVSSVGGAGLTRGGDAQLAELFRQISLGGGLKDALTGRKLTGDDLLERGITRRDSVGNPVINVTFGAETASVELGKNLLGG